MYLKVESLHPLISPVNEFPDGELPKNIHEVVSLLKQFTVYGECDNHNLVLDPLSSDVDLNNFNEVMLFFHGWNTFLRKDYLSSLSSSFLDIEKKLTTWRSKRERLTYFYGPGDNPDRRSGYIAFNFNNFPVVSFTYGNLRPERLKERMTTTAVAISLKWVLEMCRDYDFPIERIEAYVNEENIPSLKVLGANGFVIDKDREKFPATAAKGGFSRFYIRDC